MNSQSNRHTHYQAARANARPKLAKELTKPAQVTAFKGGFRVALPQKNKINLRSVDSFVQIEKTIKETLNDWKTDWKNQRPVTNKVYKSLGG